MADDLVVRLRAWSPAECWHCGEWGCLNAAGHFTWCERDCECAEHYDDTVCPTPCAECGGDAVCVCGCHTDHSSEAADEIERLRAQVAELLPLAIADAELGVTLGLHPDGDDDGCEDCQWRADATAFLARVGAGEFGTAPENLDGPT